MEAMVEENLLEVFKQVILTAHGCRFFENSCHLRIHLDSKIFFDHDFFVSGFDLLLDPFRETILENSGADITEPLLRCLGELKVRLWQIFVHLRMVIVKELAYLLDAKSVVSVS